MSNSGVIFQSECSLNTWLQAAGCRLQAFVGASGFEIDEIKIVYEGFQEVNGLANRDGDS